MAVSTRRGYAHTSLRDIADTRGFIKAALYYRVPASPRPNKLLDLPEADVWRPAPYQLTSPTASIGRHGPSRTDMSAVSTAAVYEPPTDVAGRFRPPQSIGVTASLSAFPLWRLHMSTAEDPATTSQGGVALQTVLHEATHPSHVLPPVQPS